MNKNIIIAAVGALLIAGVGYWYFFMKSSGDATSEGTPSGSEQAAPTATDQVQGQDLTVGTGRVAEPNTQVTVEYVGQLENGTVFDSSEAQGQPLVFTLGAPGIIPGFQIGINGMKEGGERAILIPAALAYGDQAVGPIPPNSNLIFKLKLVKVEDAPAQAPQQ